MRYSIEPRDRIYAKDMGFCLLLKKWVKVKVIYMAKNFLIVLKNLQQML